MSFPNIPKIPDFRKLKPRFGELLREHRTLRGVSIVDLAAQVSIAPDALREIEDGARQAPPKNIVRDLAAALNLTGETKSDFFESAELDSHAMNTLFGPGGMFGAPEPEPKRPIQAAAIFVFLIADIRGYTSYTEQYGDEAAARLATNFATLARTVMERWDGRLVEVRGDEALGVFASARQAVRAAGDLQARYTETASLHPQEPQGIGIGLDIGEAVPVDDGYRGAALNRAARLCALAGPGEVFVSPGIFYVAPHIDGVRFISRGQERLKGLPEPVAILQAAPSDIVDATIEPDDEDEGEEI